MRERSGMIAWIRGELVGPSRPLVAPTVVEFADRLFLDTIPFRSGPLAWRPASDSELQEVLYFERESPYRKYGIGLLHPLTAPETTPPPDQTALQGTDSIGAEPEADKSSGEESKDMTPDEDDDTDEPAVETTASTDPVDDFEVSSPDIRHPSTIGI